MGQEGSVPADFTFGHRAVSVDHLKELQADIDRLENEGKISRNSVNGPGHACSRKSWIFAFSNGDSTLDYLVSKDSNLVYTTKDMGFISKGEKSILRTSGQMVLSGHGKPFVVDTPHQPHDCC
jgi:hypothetical protein